MALNDRLSDGTVKAMIALVRDLDERFGPGYPVHGSALYGDSGELTLRQEIQHLREATSHV